MDEYQSVGDRFNAIVSEARSIGTAAFPAVLAYLAVMVALTVALDMGYLSGIAELTINIVNVIAVYTMLNFMIDRSGMAPEGRQGGFWTYFGVSILSGLAILVGLLLLLIPGLFLMIRWAPVYGYTLVQGVGAADSMGRAWDSTRGHVWPILLALLLPTMCILMAFGIVLGFELTPDWDAVLFSDDAADVSLATSVAGNFLVYLSTVLSSAIGLSIFTLLEGSGESVSDVFD